MIRIFPTLTAMTAAVLCGVVHGVWTDRWQPSQAPAAAAAHLRDVSLTLDGWDGEAVPKRQAPGQGVTGDLYCRYTQRRTGKTVQVYLVCGLPGEIAIHSPDVCYKAAGFESAKPTAYTLPEGGPEASFWTSHFRKKSAADATDLRIYWAWNAGDGWQATEEPRPTFAGQPVLFKLYLIYELSGADEVAGQDPCPELMKQLLPELQRALFTPS